MIVHLSFTEALFGKDAREAADRVCSFAATIHEAGGLVTATLHDLPQPAEGDTRYRYRRESYRRVVATCDGVVYNSEHERSLARKAGLIDPPDTAVVPLPLWTPPASNDRFEPVGLGGAATVFGHLYPGKGHREAIEYLAASDAFVPRRLIALGACSPGHGELVQDLCALGTGLGIQVRITGHIPNGHVLPALRHAGIPLAPHRHVSASGSIAAWMAAGRRPLVADSPYTAELEDRWPGCIQRVRQGKWPAALAVATKEPETTRMENMSSWNWTDVKLAYEQFFSGVFLGINNIRPVTEA